MCSDKPEAAGMSEEEKLLTGKLFNPFDAALTAIKCRAHQLCADYGQLPDTDTPAREAMLKALLARVGKGVYMQGPIYFNYGRHTRIGDNFFGNYNLVISDDAAVVIGDNCMFGPNTVIVTPEHPLVAEERRHYFLDDGSLATHCYARPVHIGDDCWLGANVTVCGGVTIGSGAVIGAGSVVTHDIPPHCVAAGTPCRVLREITDEDSLRGRRDLFSEEG